MRRKLKEKKRRFSGPRVKLKLKTKLKKKPQNTILVYHENDYNKLAAPFNFLFIIYHESVWYAMDIIQASNNMGQMSRNY